MDVGWLNSRRDDVGRRKEAELWAQAREMTEQWGRGKQSTKENKDEEMDIDLG